MIILDFGPFWGIFGPPTQLPRPIDSERPAHSCHLNVLRYSSPHEVYFGLLKV